jgi:TPP-dependent pyruvate/acetoin dehydrogenase alpha subunit
VAEEQWLASDPIARLTGRAIAAGWIDPAGVDALRTAAHLAVEEALQFARASPFPEPELPAELVYAR